MQIKGLSYNRGGAWKAGCEARGSISGRVVAMGVCVGVGVETSEMVEDEEEREQPEEREEPEKETFRMWRSRGRRDDLRRWPKPCSTCMLMCCVWLVIGLLVESMLVIESTY